MWLISAGKNKVFLAERRGVTGRKKPGMVRPNGGSRGGDWGRYIKLKLRERKKRERIPNLGWGGRERVSSFQIEIRRSFVTPPEFQKKNLGLDVIIKQLAKRGGRSSWAVRPTGPGKRPKILHILNFPQLGK